MKNERFFLFIMLICVILAVIAVVIFNYYQWIECKEMGMTNFYCIKHVL